MKRILLIAFLPMLALGQGEKSVNQIAEQVTLNKTFEGTIQKDEIHAYQIKLESRQFVYGRVEQKVWTSSSMVGKMRGPKTSGREKWER